MTSTGKAQAAQALAELEARKANRERVAAGKGGHAPEPAPDTFTAAQVKAIVAEAIAQEHKNAYKQPGEVRVIKPATAPKPASGNKTPALAKVSAKARAKLPDIADFTVKFIKAKRDTAHSLGIHARISGYNAAVRTIYGLDPIAVQDDLVARGVITRAWRHGGAQLYMPADAKATQQQAPDTASLLKQLGF